MAVRLSLAFDTTAESRLSQQTQQLYYRCPETLTLDEIERVRI